MISNGSVDKRFSSFYNKLNKLVKKHAPLKTVSKCKAKQLSKPWITRGLCKSIKIKNDLFYSGDTATYKLYRNKILSLSRQSKRLYYHSYFSSNLNNMKKTWEGINTLINKHRKTKTVSSLQLPANQGTTQNQLKIATALNHHFTSVGPKLANSIPLATRDFKDYLGNSNYSNSFFFDAVTPTEIELEILSTPANKAYGLYSCPVRLLKSASQAISHTLAELMNMSITIGIYPHKLKHAIVTPIYKADDETDPNNYRPISLLSVLNRIFEKLMYKRLKSFINKNDMFFSSQYGFRENCSTQHAILDILNKIQNNIDKRFYSCGIFIDLKKAFDTVDHPILLYKLHHYGIRGIINDWFSSYLSVRMQSTQIGSIVSSKERIVCGVPQGSVLGPLLFSIYVNDMHRSSKEFDFYLFADDTNLLYAEKDLNKLEVVVNEELLKLCEWLNSNKLSLNVSKSNFVIFHPYQRKVYREVNLKILDNNSEQLVSLERKTYVKYLGVLIDGNLSWKYHINYISTKISKGIGIIARLRHLVPRATLLNIYRSLIEPYISYGLVAWGQAANAHLNKLVILQKRVLRLMYFTDYTSHSAPLFACSGILPIKMLYFKLVASLLHDIENHCAPPNISELFTRTEQVHSYSTRSLVAESLYINQARTNHLLLSFSRVGAKIWNGIPPELRKLRKTRFKRKLTHLLLKILETEEMNVDLRYIDLSSLHYFCTD